MADDRHKMQVKFLLLGFLVGCSMFFLLGAKSQDDVVLLASDRYRVSAWGDAHSHGAFIVDSLTGSTKLAYQHYYTDPAGGSSNSDQAREEVEGANISEDTGTHYNRLGLPFSQIP